MFREASAGRFLAAPESRSNPLETFVLDLRRGGLRWRARTDTSVPSGSDSGLSKTITPFFTRPRSVIGISLTRPECFFSDELDSNQFPAFTQGPVLNQ